MPKSQVNIYKLLEKNVWETIWSLKFTKSNAHNFTKNQWGVTKLNLWVMVTDLHAKKSGQYLQAFRKKVWKNCLIAEIC